MELTKNIHLNFSFLNEEELNNLLEKGLFKIFNLKRGAYILQAGQVCKSIHFLVKGSIRQYAMKEGEEINFLFYFDNDFVFDELSFYEKSKSKYYFKTLEDTIILQIDETVFNTFRDDHRWVNFLFGLSKTNVARLYKRNEVLLMESPEERYIKLLTIHPQIIEKVSLAKIASFIGIEPPSLSRIRKRIAKRQIS